MDYIIVALLFGAVGFVAGLLVMRKHYNRVKETEAAITGAVDIIKGK